MRVTPIRTVAKQRPLVAALRARGLDVESLAIMCEVGESTVYAWDAGTRRPAARHASTIATLIGADETRALYARTAKIGRGRLPDRGSDRERRGVRATLHLLREAGAHDVARLVETILGPPQSAA